MSYNALIFFGYSSCVAKVKELRQRADTINATSSANTSLNASLIEKKSS
jgi:hypothetical protein